MRLTPANEAGLTSETWSLEKLLADASRVGYGQVRRNYAEERISHGGPIATHLILRRYFQSRSCAVTWKVEPSLETAMSPTIQDLGIDRLSAPERLRLIGEIWDSLSHAEQI